MAQDISKTDLEALSSNRATTLENKAETYLLKAEEPNRGIYQLTSGNAYIELNAAEEKIKVLHLRRGDWFGKPIHSGNDTFSFNVFCQSDCQFDYLPWEESLNVTTTRENLTAFFDEFAHYLHTCATLIQAFGKIYKNISPEFLEGIIRLGRFKHLKENETLFEQGDESQVMYFLLSGKIDVYVGKKQKLTRVGEIFHGEPFGEMSLFSGETRTATLVATRPSELISLSRRTFDKLASKYPQLSSYIVNSLIGRVRKQNSQKQIARQPVNRLLLFPHPPQQSALYGQIRKQLSGSQCSLITEEELSGHLNPSQIANITQAQLVDQLDSIEQRHVKNLYFSDCQSTEWTKICLERAEEVWLIVDHESDKDIITHQLRAYQNLYSWKKQKKILVLTHQRPAKIQHTTQWLTQFTPDQHFHIKLTSKNAISRLTRYLTDTSIGLILGGGGARGFAQVGVLQALEEAKYPIDWIGGTSIGSVMGGWMAMGWDSRQIKDAVQQFFVTANPLGDYTLPLISLSRSQRLDLLLKKGFGSTQIEDLPIPYFCVSSDMSIAEERHHEKGSLWEAIRASISIPGVIAPVIENGHYLVDGGLLNNLPCDLMQQRNRGPLVAVDVSPHEDCLTQLHHLPSPWKMLWNKMLRKSQAKVPSILETMLRSSLLSSTHRQRINREMVDLFVQPDVHNVGMLDFKSADKAIEAGYIEALKSLEQWQVKAFSEAS